MSSGTYFRFFDSYIWFFIGCFTVVPLFGWMSATVSCWKQWNVKKDNKTRRYYGEVNMILSWLPSINVASVLGKEFSTLLQNNLCIAGDKIDIKYFNLSIKIIMN